MRNRNKKSSRKPAAKETTPAPVEEANGDETDATVEEELERAAIAEAPEADTDSEFATDWHRDQYTADLVREVEGAKRRLEELKETDASDAALADQQTMIDNASAELARVTKLAKKRS